MMIDAGSGRWVNSQAVEIITRLEDSSMKSEIQLSSGNRVYSNKSPETLVQEINE